MSTELSSNLAPSSQHAWMRVAENLSPRKREILEIAAQLFAHKGYRGPLAILSLKH